MKNTTLFILFFALHLSAQSPFSTPGIILADTVETQSVVWGDYNNDGWDDLFLSRGDEATGASATNLLLLNQSGVLAPQTVSGVTTLNDLSGGATWGDYNNDGHLDLYVAVAAPLSGKNNNLFLNDGVGGFVDKTGATDVGDIANDPEDSGFTGWGDYDNNGYLDMFVDNGLVMFIPPDLMIPRKQVNSFYKNVDGFFTKQVPEEIGKLVSSDPTYTTFRSGFAWFDYNNDGYLDIFNGSGYGSGNKMWKNSQADSFVQVFDFSEDFTSTRGASWADFDNDGDFDLFTSNIIDGDRGANFMYENFSTPELDSLLLWGSEYGPIVTDVYYSNGSTWGDFDNDGDLDLFVASYGNPDSNEISRYYQNSGFPDYEFTVQRSETDTLDAYNGTKRGFGRAAAAADVDQDGDLDLAVSRTGNPLLYINQNIGNNWTQVKLTGNGNTNTTAIGARIKLIAQITGQGGRTVQLREISGQTGAGGQNSLTAHFGLGDATQIDSLVLIWPTTGNQEIFTNLAVNQFYSFIETEVSGLSSDSKQPAVFKLFNNYPNPFNPSTTISYHLSNPDFVRLQVYDVLGESVQILVDKNQTAGTYSVSFDAQGLANGVYYYSLKAGSKTQVRKMILLK